MRPELLSLGPWSPATIPVIVAVVFGLALLWLKGEQRWGTGAPVTLRRALIALVPSVLLAVLIYTLVNHFGPVKIKAWGTALVLAFSVGTAYMARYGDRKVTAPAECLDLALYCLIGAIIGARVIFVALDWGHYASHAERLLNVWEGGLSFHGGLFGALLAALIFAKLRHKVFFAVIDVTAPGLALGYAITRLGCFLNGCCHGHECHLPWAMRFPYGELPNVPVHPTQLYACASSLVIAIILHKLRGRFPRPGHLFLFYLCIYSVYRFLVEYTRAGATGKPTPGLPAMTEGQTASIIIFVVAAVTMALSWRKSPTVAPETETPAEPAATPPPKRKS